MQLTAQCVCVIHAADSTVCMQASQAQEGLQQLQRENKDLTTGLEAANAQAQYWRRLAFTLLQERQNTLALLGPTAMVRPIG